MADVFISYKTERRNAAQHLSRILELNGYSVWFDYGLLSGTDFGPQIERELRAAKAVVVLWCGLSHDSRWVLEEAHLAERLGTLTPVWLEAVELPLGFGRADTIDLSSWDGSPRSPALDRLLNEVGRRVGRDAEPSFRGLQHYEETWRSFGSPPLSRFALVDPLDEEARSFGVQPRLHFEAPAREQPRPPAATPAATPGSGARNAALVAAAAAVLIAGAAAWYWRTASHPQPQPAPAPAAQATPQSQTAPPQAQAASPAPPPAAQPVNAPLASFMRSNSGWSVTLSFVDPVTAISWRLGDTGAFKETGFLDALDPRTRRRIARPSFELDPNQPAATIEIRAVDISGNTVGPFPIAFDPAAELEHGDRSALEMTSGSWLAFNDSDDTILYYTALVTYRCAIREMRIGIDSTVPNKVIPLPECDQKRPYEIPNSAQTYLRLPPGTKMVSVELTYRDGSVSETKTFRR
ncbi:MAG TPA: toll/interleukin-1 receptor domain-containing protein [Stellaceae bacterium]|nr:toll/interleukin-1 receptor domain-containing protein [Stellaceae bacterium]